MPPAPSVPVLMLVLVLVLVLVAGCPAAAPAERPRPPYPTFEGTTFEPSAVGYDPATDRYLVLNDKDAICYRYRLEGARLVPPKDSPHRSIHLPGKDFALKFEALTRLEDGAFLAATAFDRPSADFRKVIKFRFANEGEIDAELVPFAESELTARLRKIDPGLTYWKVEGLAATRGDRAALLAIRSVGKNHADKRDVVWIARCPRTEAGFGAPDRLVQYDARAAVGREEGASSLERDPRTGDYYLLTSYEDEANEGSVAAHGAHLYRLPAADLEAAPPDPAPRPLPPPLRSFAAKAEGLAVTPGGDLLLVFDDDQPWKKLFQGYEQHQGLFLFIPRAELGR